jgi:hypothetical protein
MLFTGASRPGAGGYAHAERREHQSRRMSAYALACDTLAPRLSDADMAVVRESGELPDWFYDEVRKAAKAHMRRR